MTISALKSRNFRLYLGGNLFSLHALWMLRVVVMWIAWDMTRSASFVGLVAFLYFFPSMVAGPVFGVVVDRVNIRIAAILTQFLMMTLAAMLMAAWMADFLNAPGLAIYSVSMGTAMAAYGPIRMSMAPRLVDRDHVQSVITMVSLNYNLARLSGPAIGGWLIALAGVGQTLAVIVACYLPFLVVLSVVGVRDVEPAPPTMFLSAFRDGVAYALRDPAIREALALTALSSVVLMATLEILPILADGIFDRGAAGLGVITSAAGLGSLVAGGMIMAMARGEEGGGVPAFCYGVTMLGMVSLAGLSQISAWPVALGVVALVAFSGTVISVLCQSAIQSSIEDGMRGRVMSLWALVAVGNSAIGAVVLGVMIDRIGFGATVTACGGIGAIGVAALAMRRRAGW